jgi:hypothetical protein
VDGEAIVLKIDEDLNLLNESFHKQTFQRQTDKNNFISKQKTIFFSKQRLESDN